MQQDTVFRRQFFVCQQSNFWKKLVYSSEKCFFALVCKFFIRELCQAIASVISIWKKSGDNKLLANVSWVYFFIILPVFENVCLKVHIRVYWYRIFPAKPLSPHRSLKDYSCYLLLSLFFLLFYISLVFFFVGSFLCIAGIDILSVSQCELCSEKFGCVLSFWSGIMEYSKRDTFLSSHFP